MTRYIPYTHRAPNKFVRYYEQSFDDGHGHTGIERIVVYINKHGKEVHEQFLIKWDKGVYD